MSTRTPIAPTQTLSLTSAPTLTASTIQTPTITSSNSSISKSQTQQQPQPQPQPQPQSQSQSHSHPHRRRRRRRHRQGRIDLIFNEVSGQRDARSDLTELCHILQQSFSRVHVWRTSPTYGGDHAARDAIADGAELVIACGGDGTVTAVASALRSRPVKLGVIPRGTANALCNALHIPTGLADAARMIANGGPTRNIDFPIVTLQHQHQQRHYQQLEIDKKTGTDGAVKVIEYGNGHTQGGEGNHINNDDSNCNHSHINDGHVGADHHHFVVNAGDDDDDDEITENITVEHEHDENGVDAASEHNHGELQFIPSAGRSSAAPTTSTSNGLTHQPSVSPQTSSIQGPLLTSVSTLSSSSFSSSTRNTSRPPLVSPSSQLLSSSSSRSMLLLCGVGLEAETVRRASRRLKRVIGAAAYAIAGLETVWRQVPFDAMLTLYEMERPDVPFSRCTIRTHGMTQFNCTRLQGITVANAAPPASVLAHGVPGGVIPDDGLLEVVCIAATPPLGMIGTMFRLLWSAVSGKPPTNITNVYGVRAKKVLVECHPPQPVVIDGESVGLTPVMVQLGGRAGASISGDEKKDKDCENRISVIAPPSTSVKNKVTQMKNDLHRTMSNVRAAFMFAVVMVFAKAVYNKCGDDDDDDDDDSDNEFGDDFENVQVVTDDEDDF